MPLSEIAYNIAFDLPQAAASRDLRNPSSTLQLFTAVFFLPPQQSDDLRLRLFRVTRNPHANADPSYPYLVDALNQLFPSVYPYPEEPTYDGSPFIWNRYTLLSKEGAPRRPKAGSLALPSLLESARSFIDMLYIMLVEKQMVLVPYYSLRNSRDYDSRLRQHDDLPIFAQQPYEDQIDYPLVESMYLEVVKFLRMLVSIKDVVDVTYYDKLVALLAKLLESMRSQPNSQFATWLTDPSFLISNSVKGHEVVTKLTTELPLLISLIERCRELNGKDISSLNFLPQRLQIIRLDPNDSVGMSSNEASVLSRANTAESVARPRGETFKSITEEGLLPPSQQLSPLSAGSARVLPNAAYSLESTSAPALPARTLEFNRAEQDLHLSLSYQGSHGLFMGDMKANLALPKSLNQSELLLALTMSKNDWFKWVHLFPELQPCFAHREYIQPAGDGSLKILFPADFADWQNISMRIWPLVARLTTVFTKSYHSEAFKLCNDRSFLDYFVEYLVRLLKYTVQYKTSMPQTDVMPYIVATHSLLSSFYRPTSIKSGSDSQQPLDKNFEQFETTYSSAGFLDRLTYGQHEERAKLICGQFVRDNNSILDYTMQTIGYYCAKYVEALGNSLKQRKYSTYIFMLRLYLALVLNEPTKTYREIYALWGELKINIKSGKEQDGAFGQEILSNIISRSQTLRTWGAKILTGAAITLAQEQQQPHYNHRYMLADLFNHQGVLQQPPRTLLGVISQSRLDPTALYTFLDIREPCTKCTNTGAVASTTRNTISRAVTHKTQPCTCEHGVRALLQSAAGIQQLPNSQIDGEGLTENPLYKDRTKGSSVRQSFRRGESFKRRVMRGGDDLSRIEQAYDTPEGRLLYPDGASWYAELRQPTASATAGSQQHDASKKQLWQQLDNLYEVVDAAPSRTLSRPGYVEMHSPVLRTSSPSDLGASAATFGHIAPSMMTASEYPVGPLVRGAPSITTTSRPAIESKGLLGVRSLAIVLLTENPLVAKFNDLEKSYLTNLLIVCLSNEGRPLSFIVYFVNSLSTSYTPNLLNAIIHKIKYHVIDLSLNVNEIHLLINMVKPTQSGRDVLIPENLLEQLQQDDQDLWFAIRRCIEINKNSASVAIAKSCAILVEYSTLQQEQEPIYEVIGNPASTTGSPVRTFAPPLASSPHAASGGAGSQPGPGALFGSPVTHRLDSNSFVFGGDVSFRASEMDEGIPLPPPNHPGYLRTLNRMRSGQMPGSPQRAAVSVPVPPLSAGSASEPAAASAAPPPLPAARSASFSLSIESGKPPAPAWFQVIDSLVLLLMLLANNELPVQLPPSDLLNAKQKVCNLLDTFLTPCADAIARPLIEANISKKIISWLDANNFDPTLVNNLKIIFVCPDSPYPDFYLKLLSEEDIKNQLQSNGVLSVLQDVASQYPTLQLNLSKKLPRLFKRPRTSLASLSGAMEGNTYGFSILTSLVKIISLSISNPPAIELSEPEQACLADWVAAFVLRRGEPTKKAYELLQHYSSGPQNRDLLQSIVNKLQSTNSSPNSSFSDSSFSEGVSIDAVSARCDVADAVRKLLVPLEAADPFLTKNIPQDVLAPLFENRNLWNTLSWLAWLPSKNPARKFNFKYMESLQSIISYYALNSIQSTAQTRPARFPTPPPQRPSSPSGSLKGNSSQQSSVRASPSLPPPAWLSIVETLITVLSYNIWNNLPDYGASDSLTNEHLGVIQTLLVNWLIKYQERPLPTLQGFNKARNRMPQFQGCCKGRSLADVQTEIIQLLTKSGVDPDVVEQLKIIFGLVQADQDIAFPSSKITVKQTLQDHNQWQYLVEVVNKMSDYLQGQVYSEYIP